MTWSPEDEAIHQLQCNIEDLTVKNKELLQALLDAHGELEDHDGALYCKCPVAKVYQKYAKAEGK